MTLTLNQIITHKDGHTRQILEVGQNAVLFSTYNNHDKASAWATESELRDLGYTWSEQKVVWTPQDNQEYWLIISDSEGGFEVISDVWEETGSIDQARRDSLLGIFSSESLAQARIKEIEEFLRK